MKKSMRYLVTVVVLALAMLVSSCSSVGDADDSAVSETPTATAETEDTPSTGGGPQNSLRRFSIVADESKASYIVDEEFFGGALDKYGIAAGMANTVGSTNAIEGQLELDLSDTSSALGTNKFTVDLSTLASDQSLRDQWLRRNGPNFNQYPTASFTASSIESAPSSYTDGELVSFKMSGDMTIRETTNPVTFDVSATLTGDTLTGTAIARLLMTDFGIDPPNFANTLTVADEFEVRVDFTAKDE
jgi:polyisoprenoid-binding protein YceI